MDLVELDRRFRLVVFMVSWFPLAAAGLQMAKSPSQEYGFVLMAGLMAEVWKLALWVGDWCGQINGMLE